jgi:hypothetical protein
MLLVGCHQPSPREIELNEANRLAQNALLLDLEEAPKPAAALLIQTRTTQPQLKVLAVPFALQSSLSERLLLVASSTQTNSSLITVLVTPSLPEYSLVRLPLVFEQAEESEFIRDDLKGFAYYMASGLKRRFYYRSPSATELASEPWRNITPVVNTLLTHVIIRLPSGSEVFERTASALAPVFEKDSPRGKVRAYAYDQTSTRPIDLRYQVPPTKLQKQIFDYGIKLFIALLAPIAALMFLTSDKVRSPKARKKVLWVGGIIESVIFVGLIWWAFFIQSVVGLEALLDVILAVIGVLATAMLAFIKKPDAD